MHKIHYIKNGCDTTILFPEAELRAAVPFRVEEIGHSIRPAGYRTSITYRNCYALHFVLQGKGEYAGQAICAPSCFLMPAGGSHYYVVSGNPQDERWEHYWMLLSGDSTDAFLRMGGVEPSSWVKACGFINQAQQVFEELLDPKSYLNITDSSYLLAGFFQLLSLFNTGRPPMPLQGGETEGKKEESQAITVVQRVCAIIHEHYAEPLRNEDFSEATHLSVKYLLRVFKKKTGITPMQYLTYYRIRNARRLLLHSDLSVNEIGVTVGYRDANYFCVTFQKHNKGISPKAFRQQNSDETERIIES